ncbi:MAG: DUF4199 domain-containing protein [Planctomycetia bacterium]|nr:DUF4199 domain-containing protein [Planctomycetia bacterium]
MKKLLLPGVVLALLLAGWMYVIGFMGWYKDAKLAATFWLVVPIQIVVLTLVIKSAAKQGAGFVGKFARGAGTSLVASPLVFLNSILFTQVVFPHYFDELRAMQESMLRAQGIPESQVTEALKAAAGMQNPYLYALFGAIGTVVTGVLVSLVVSMFVKKREG